MKKFLATLMITGVFMSLALAAEEGSRSGDKAEPGAVVHLTQSNFDETIKLHPLVLVDFWATWCPPCQLQGPILEDFANEMAAELKVGKVDVDKNRELAGKYGIRALPTLVLFKDGEVVKKYEGLHQKKELQEIIDQARKGSAKSTGTAE